MAIRADSHFSLAYRESHGDHRLVTCSKLAVKAATIVLSLSVAACLGLLTYQHYSYSALYERQNQAIALVQRQYEASLRENQALKTASQMESRSRIALSQAQPIAARYQRVFKAQVNGRR